MHPCRPPVFGTCRPIAVWQGHERSVKMAGLSEEDIFNRAYHLWKQAGEPAGAMDTLWYQAEAELLAERAEQGEVPPGMTDNLPV
ncbi:DUF2934 domain-containing protein [Bradyrhizobium sp. CCGUVB14]|uniref:DUF2934 domain-containing protein n=1 Tax=Bradyrhizobium sp. CCGUVB14 TaxID=2949628 RepID=UPI0028120D3B|nr:DUF2934 domain-containing protein [Bradyrhizobium sp. CCGUVB14]